MNWITVKDATPMKNYMGSDVAGNRFYQVDAGRSTAVVIQVVLPEIHRLIEEEKRDPHQLYPLWVHVKQHLEDLTGPALKGDRLPGLPEVGQLHFIYQHDAATQKTLTRHLRLVSVTRPRRAVASIGLVIATLESPPRVSTKEHSKDDFYRCTRDTSSPIPTTPRAGGWCG